MQAKKAARPARRQSPQETYRRLLDLHARTALELARLEDKHGFTSQESETAAALRVAPAFALDQTANPAFMKATFIVPNVAMQELLHVFFDHARPMPQAI